MASQVPMGNKENWQWQELPEGDGAPPLAGDGIPSGIIVMWSGLIANIPTGWVLCDGQNGTPDLRDKFIKSVGASENPGAMGGGTTYTHSGVAVANHVALSHGGTGVANHVFTQPNAHTEVINHTHSVNDPGHTHNIGNQLRSATTGSQTTNIALSTDTSSTQGTYPSTSNTTGITTNNPTDGVASIAHSGGAVDAHQVTQPSNHAEQSHNVTQPSDHTGVEPPFYKLAFIMKT